jgi:hypothetical protein
VKPDRAQRARQLEVDLDAAVEALLAGTQREIDAVGGGADPVGEAERGRAGIALGRGRPLARGTGGGGDEKNRAAHGASFQGLTRRKCRSW